MKRPASAIVLAAVAVGGAIVVLAAVQRAAREDPASCGPGFHRVGPRCCVAPGPLVDGELCPSPAQPIVCPAPLVASGAGCDAPRDDVVQIPATTVTIGPSDWEAEGRVEARVIATRAFAIDRFELTEGHGRDGADAASRDAARALANVTRDEARALCRARGGRLPTESEWIVAAAGSAPRRYPWGDTGAVCRRAAWGLAAGPCGKGARGPDTVGAHESGATPLGVHDLAGNVAEWVEADAPQDEGVGIVKGGSFETDLATELRVWVRRELPAGARSPSVGLRCAFDVAPVPSGPEAP